MVDPATVNELTSNDGETMYDYEYYAAYRPWRDTLADDVATNTGVWLDMLKAEDFAQEAQRVRDVRDELLSKTDYLVTIDYPIPDNSRSAVVVYRQALRDVSDQDGFPYSIQWPDKPIIPKGGDTLYEIIEEMTGEG
ncbi:hypothetical protein AGMMS49992_10740 [Clostridia bacterium]|nr:hypothetical protein AGMMS49992_10740 [Clostridia bacterium]